MMVASDEPMIPETQQMIVEFATEFYRQRIQKRCNVVEIAENAICDICAVNRTKFPVVIPINDEAYNIESIEIDKRQVFVKKYIGVLTKRVFKSLDEETSRFILMKVVEFFRNAYK